MSLTPRSPSPSPSPPPPPDEPLHRHLVGVPGSRRSLCTPVLVLDRPTLDANIAAMAELARSAGVALRPHAKTHKSAAIARRQLAAGAVGQCCAKLGEAEALADAGIDGLLITSPVVSDPAVQRVAALNARSEGLQVTADHPDAVDALAAAAASAGGPPLTVVVDVDPGIHRTGVTSPERAVALARHIADQRSLRFGGVQFYCGAEQHIAAFADRRAAVVGRTELLRAALDALDEAGLPAPLVTGGGTGTHRIDLELGVFTELQMGSYVFMDRQYLDCELTDRSAEGDDGDAGDSDADADADAAHGEPPFTPALVVDARVVSANTPGLATVDAGFKAFSTDAGPPSILAGAPPGTRYGFAGDEHGFLRLPDRATGLPLDAPVTFVVPHCDPTVNLYDTYHVVEGDTLVDLWPIDARGRSR